MTDASTARSPDPDSLTPRGVQFVPPPADLGPRPEEFVQRERELLTRDFPEHRTRVTTLRKRLSLQPGDAALRAELGEILYGLDLPRLAERELLLAAAADPDFGQVHLLLGDIYRARSEHGRSLWHLERARALVPGRHEPWQLEGMVLRELGDSAGAARLVTAGLERVPGQPELLVLLARLENDLGRPEEAEVLLVRALARVPDHLRAHLLRAQVLMQLEREDEAEDENALHERLVLLDRAGALDLDPPMEEWRRAAVLASHHNLTGRMDLALSELDRSYALNPGNADARVVEGSLLASDGREAEALALYELVLETEPRHTRALKQLALLLLQAEDESLRDPERALALAKVSLEAAGNSDVGSLLALGLAYAAAGQELEARVMLERVLMLAPGHGTAQRALAEL